MEQRITSEVSIDKKPKPPLIQTENLYRCWGTQRIPEKPGELGSENGAGRRDPRRAEPQPE